MVRTSLATVSALLAASAAEPPRSLLPRSASLQQDDVSWLHEPSEAALHAGRRRDALSLFAHGNSPWLHLAWLSSARPSCQWLSLPRFHLLTTLRLTTRLVTTMTGTASSITDGGQKRSRARTPRRYASRSVRARVRVRATVSVSVRVSVIVRIRIGVRAGV